MSILSLKQYDMLYQYDMIYIFGTNSFLFGYKFDGLFTFFLSVFIVLLSSVRLLGCLLEYLLVHAENIYLEQYNGI